VTPRFFVRRAARADIAEAFRWYERRSAGLGHEFLRSVRVAFAEIGTRARTISIAVDDVHDIGDDVRS